MSKNFWLLLKTNLRLTFNSQKLFNRQSKPVSKSKGAFYTFFMLFMVAYFMLFSGLFFYGLGTMLAPGGLIDLLVFLAIIAYTVLILITALFSANGYLFKAKDLQLMLSLPVSHFTVLSVKFVLQYVFELIFAVFILGPAFFFYFYFTSSVSALAIICAILCFFAAPLIPMAVGSLLSYFIGLLTRRMRKKNFFTIIITTLLMVGWIVLVRNGNSIADYILKNGSSLREAFSQYYFPSEWLLGALNADILKLLLFIVINIAVQYVVFVIISRKYSDIIAILNSSGVRRKAKLGNLNEKSSGALGSMIKKELSMYFSSSNYVLNTFLGSIMLIVAGIALLFMDKNTFLSAFEAQGIAGISIAAVITVFCPSISPTTSSVISLEGKKLWIYKSIPANTKDILKAKTAVNLIVNIPAVVIGDLLLTIGLDLSVLDYLLLVFLGSSFVLLFSLSGIMINLAKPKLDFENEIIVIKQSASVMIQTFMGMGIMFGMIIIYAVSGMSNFYLFALSVLIIIWAVIILLGYKLFSWGVEKFNQL